MACDIGVVLKDMANAAKGIIAGDWPGVQNCVQQSLKDQEDDLKDIAAARIKGDITDDDLKSQLEDQKGVLEAALLVCKIKGKKMAQDAVNAAFAVLEKAIMAALP